MPRKFISYDRFSGKRQEAGDSLRRQDSLAEQAAREEGLPIDRTICLRDKGVSAFRGRNWKKGDLGKFIDLVDGGVVPAGSILCIEQVNRLSRMPWMMQVEQWKEILSRGIVIRTCVPPARYTRENLDDLAVGCPVVIMMMLAHQESKQKSEWSREAWGEKRRHALADHRPHGARCPAWIEAVSRPHPLDPERSVTTAYRLREDRAAVLRRIHECSVEGWGGHRILNELLRTVPPWTKKGWTRPYVELLLRSRSALGEYQPTVRNDLGVFVPHGPPIPGYYPVAVPEALFLASEGARRGRKRAGGRPGRNGAANLFTRLVYDGDSGEPMSLSPTVVGGVTYLYLRADRGSLPVPYQPFERAALDAVAALKAKDVDGVHQADALTARVDALQAERARLGMELDALDAQLRELPPDRWPKRVVARMSELEAAVSAKDQELRTAKEAANTSGRTEALSDLNTAVQLLDEVAGTPREGPVRERIKRRLSLIVEEIWVRVQRVSHVQRLLHLRLYLRGGGQTPTFVVPCGQGRLAAAPLPLRDVDLRASWRAGQVGRDAVNAGRGLDGQAAREAG